MYIISLDLPHVKEVKMSYLLEIEYYKNELERAKNLWIVGKDTPPDWEFFGVFSTYERALAECRDEDFFIAPIKVDVSEPEETEVFEGIVYPLEVLTEKE